MARTPKNLALAQLASVALTTIYTAPVGTNTPISKLSFTNTTSTAISIDIYHSTASTDFLIDTLTIPGGSGRKRIFYGWQLEVLNAGEKIKIQADSTNAFNYSLNGSEQAL